MRLQSSGLLASVLIIGLTVACNRDRGHANAEPAQTTSPASPAEQADAQRALAAYERIRASLAKDSPTNLAAHAAELASNARKAATVASPASRAELLELAKSADALGQKPATDMEGLRTAFGEVSRHAVGLLVVEPSLRAGRLVFECPMAQGYKKWIQTSEGIENPYMGQKMLECGAKTDWAV